MFTRSGRPAGFPAPGPASREGRGTQTDRCSAQSGGHILTTPLYHPHVPRERVPSRYLSREVPGDGTCWELPRSRFQTLEKLQKHPPFKNFLARLPPAGLAAPVRGAWDQGAHSLSVGHPRPGPGGLLQLRGTHCLVPQVQRAKAAPAAFAGLCLTRGSSAGRSQSFSRPPGMLPSRCLSLPPHSSVLTSPQEMTAEPQASRATSVRPPCPNSDPKDLRAPSRSFPPCSSSPREDPQVLGEKELSRTQGCWAASGWPGGRVLLRAGGGASPSFPDPRKE